MDDNDQDDANKLAAFERDLMAGLKPDDEDPVLDLPQRELPAEDPAPGAPTDKPAAAVPSETQAAQTAAAPAQQAAKQADQAAQGNKGDPRAALRASRQAERQARQREDELRAENAKLREQLGQTAADPDTDPDVETLINDLPAAAPVIKKLMATVKELQQKTAAPSQAEKPAFVPDTLPDALQEDVDQIPSLSDWQHDPDQSAWNLAKRVDGMLGEHPKWRDASQADRLREVERRVLAELGTPTQQTTTTTATRTAAQVIQDAPQRDPETLSDLRGGVVPSANPGPDFNTMKSDDEVMAALARLR